MMPDRFHCRLSPLERQTLERVASSRLDQLQITGAAHGLARRANLVIIRSEAGDVAIGAYSVQLAPKVEMFRLCVFDSDETGVPLTGTEALIDARPTVFLGTRVYSVPYTAAIGSQLEIEDLLMLKGNGQVLYIYPDEELPGGIVIGWDTDPAGAGKAIRLHWSVVSGALPSGDETAWKGRR